MNLKRGLRIEYAYMNYLYWRPYLNKYLSLKESIGKSSLSNYNKIDLKVVYKKNI